MHNFTVIMSLMSKAVSGRNDTDSWLLRAGLYLDERKSYHSAAKLEPGQLPEGQRYLELRKLAAKNAVRKSFGRFSLYSIHIHYSPSGLP